jgi:hypothetical protein
VATRLKAVSLPIIFIHRGACRYLAGSIAQARQSSPGSEIFLLGDRYNAGFRLARHFETSTFSDGAEKFAAVYRHCSTHEVEYELFCFQRWFFLQSFLKARQLDACLYLDSDVLLFADATEEARAFQGCDVTLSLDSPHCLFLNRRASLDGFCDFLMECYASPALFAQIESHYLALQARNAPGGVCDMTAFGLFRTLGRGRAGDLREIREGATYDHAMGESNGYEMCDGIKRIHWRNARPECRLESTGEMVRFKALHFQGSSKRFLRRHVRLKTPGLKLAFQVNRVIGERGKLLQKLGRARR